MKNRGILLLYLIILLFNNVLFAQNDTIVETEIFPQFRNGSADLMNFIKANQVYPEELKKGRLQIGGKVFVSFMVDTTGKVSNINVVKGLHPLIDSQAVQIINKFNSPGNEWTPGFQGKRKVKVKYTLPIKYGIEEISSNGETKKGKETEMDIIEKANPYFHSGNRKLDLKEYYEAIKDYNEVLKLVPYYLDALYNRGVAKFNINDVEGACLDWNAIRKSDDGANQFWIKYCKKKKQEK